MGWETLYCKFYFLFQVSDVLALDNKMYSEGAKGNVVEEQLEAATHTIIQDMKPGVEKLISLFENEVKTLVEVRLLGNLNWP